MRSITKCPCYLKCQGLVNHEITRQRRNTNRDNYKSMGAKPNHLKERVNISKQGYILLLF